MAQQHLAEGEQVVGDERYGWDGGHEPARSNLPSEDLVVVVLTQRATDETGMPAVCEDVPTAALNLT